jgi:hypothetical protein
VRTYRVAQADARSKFAAFVVGGSRRFRMKQ